MNEEIRFHPAKFRNSYRNWMENIKDWCISRHLLWGHRMLAWYDEKGNPYVGMDEKEAMAGFIRKANPGHVPKSYPVLVRRTRTSWIPVVLLLVMASSKYLKGLASSRQCGYKYYYPTHVLVTAPEIIFFWVARMIMAGFEYMGEKPFTEVYFTGVVVTSRKKDEQEPGQIPPIFSCADQINTGPTLRAFRAIMISSPAGNDTAL